MSWWSEVPLLLATTAIFMIPGLIVAWLGGVRGFAAVAYAPAITVSIVAVGAVAAPFAGLGWVAGIVLTAVVAALAAFGAYWWFGRKGAPARPAMQWGRTAALAAAVAVAFVLIGRRLLFAFGEPDAISQTFDNVFHLNAVRFILDTGGASTFEVGEMAGNSYYPAAWHDMVALVAQLTSVSVPVAVNAANFFISSVIWPISCIYLVQRLFGHRIVLVLLTGVLSAAFGSFPLLMLDYGVLYPNVLAIAILPVALAASLDVIGMAREPQYTAVIRWLLLIAVLPGMILAHPSTLMALLAVLVPALVAAVLKRGGAGGLRGQRGWRSSPLVLWAGIAAYLVVVAVLWKVVRPVESASTWLPVQSTGQAIGEAISGTALGRPVTWVLFLLMATGLTTLLATRSQRWIGFMFVVLAGLFVVVSSFEPGALRMYLTGVWYNDTPRLAALLPVLAVPVAAYGGWKVLQWLAQVPAIASLADAVENLRPRKTAYGSVAVLAAVALVGVSAFATQGPAIRASAESTQLRYLPLEDAALISPDEMELLERLDKEVPSDAVLVGNPWTGTSLVYALGGRTPLQMHILETYGEDVDAVYNRLRDAAVDPEVCEAVASTSVDYVLDFGAVEVHGGQHEFAGLEDLEETGVGRLVDQVGDAKLYEITACR